MSGTIQRLFMLAFFAYVLLGYALLFSLWLCFLGETEATIMMGSIALPAALLLREALRAIDYLLMPRGSPPGGGQRITGALSAPVFHGLFIYICV